MKTLSILLIEDDAIEVRSEERRVAKEYKLCCAQMQYKKNDG